MGRNRVYEDREAFAGNLPRELKQWAMQWGSERNHSLNSVVVQALGEFRDRRRQSPVTEDDLPLDWSTERPRRQ